MTSLSDMFDTFQRDAWRLEALDTYNIPGEADEIRDWELNGYVAPSPTWDATIAAARDRGARIGRVRLVGHPVTLYTQFEFAAYQQNITAGEDVRIVDRRWLDDSWDAAPDVWIFDGRAWLMRYDDTGAFQGAEPVLNPAPYLELRRRLEPHAVPFADYHLTEIPDPRQEPAITEPLPAGLAITG